MLKGLLITLVSLLLAAGIVIGVYAYNDSKKPLKVTDHVTMVVDGEFISYDIEYELPRK